MPSHSITYLLSRMDTSPLHQDNTCGQRRKFLPQLTILQVATKVCAFCLREYEHRHLQGFLDTVNLMSSISTMTSGLLHRGPCRSSAAGLVHVVATCVACIFFFPKRPIACLYLTRHADIHCTSLLIQTEPQPRFFHALSAIYNKHEQRCTTSIIATTRGHP